MAQRRRPGHPGREWAGHSVDVLLKISAKCIDGDTDRQRLLIDAALDRSNGPPKTWPRIQTRTAVEPRFQPAMAGRSKIAPRPRYSR
jgi:hypothetical protein